MSIYYGYSKELVHGLWDPSLTQYYNTIFIETGLIVTKNKFLHYEPKRYKNEYDCGKLVYHYYLNRAITNLYLLLWVGSTSSASLSASSLEC